MSSNTERYIEEKSKEIGDKLPWISLIIPGFISITIFSSIVDTGEMSDFVLVVYSILITIIDIFAASLLFFPLYYLTTIVWKPPIFLSLAIFLLLLLFFSVFFGIVSGVTMEGGGFYNLVRKLPIVDVLNKRTSARPLTFILRRNSGGQLKTEGDARPKGLKVGEAWLRVYLEGGAVYEGWPEFYDSKPTEIYLSPACRILEDGATSRATRIAGPGAFIPEKRLVSAILLDRISSPCYAAWYNK